MNKNIEKIFLENLPQVDYASLRVVNESFEDLVVRKENLLPPAFSKEQGYMVTVHHQGGMGYAASSDMSVTGMKFVFEKALAWAKKSSGNSVVDFSKIETDSCQGEYHGPNVLGWETTPLKDRVDLITKECQRLKTHEDIVNWSVGLEYCKKETFFVSSAGARNEQVFYSLVPSMNVTAYRDGESQSRSFGGYRSGRQGGLENLESLGFYEAAPQIAEEVMELIAAPDCPKGNMDLLLAPDQLILQIHESIGHPLELDRILGDERNYAGTSFVTPEMFGSYQYGSELLNISFDPSHPEELASYAWDDEGQKAEKTLLIEKGILKKPLGGGISRQRAGMEGVANSRACSWNRPPIDRMANLNLEPGESSFEEMVSSVERGVYMQANCSWSIDDSRNKFQFGCERGVLIEDGKLTSVVKNPNYRGVSATFWRGLKKVGDLDSFEILGTTNCGKGEPNQSISVAHATPACLFDQVDVFGGA